MKALLHVNTASPLGSILGISPWVLIPVGNRPLIEYWIELCVDLGIAEIKILLGDGGEQVEEYAGAGERWGVKISYAFEKAAGSPTAFLARNTEEWADGLLHIRGVCFPARGADFSGKALSVVSAASARTGNAMLFCGTDRDAIKSYISGEPTATSEHPELTLVALETAKDFHALSMRLVGGESTRYVVPGYEVTSDGCHIGYNTIMPASARFTAPVMIGNNTRIQPLTDVGPNAIVGNHVVIDAQTELSNSIIMDNTYVGRNLEIKGKIVSANRLIDPESDTCLELDDPWLLDAIKPSRRFGDVVRGLVGWLIALLVVGVQCVPYLLLRFILPATSTLIKRHIVCGRDSRPISMLVFEAIGGGSMQLRLFRRLLLDLFPRFLLVLEGRLWLCGHAPLSGEVWEAEHKELREYLPGAVTYSDSQPLDMRTPGTELIDASYYLHMRGLAEDMRIFGRAVIYRLTRLA